MKRTLPISIRIVGISIVLVTICLAIMNLMVTDQVTKGVQTSQEHNLGQSVQLTSRFLGEMLGNLQEKLGTLAGNLSRVVANKAEIQTLLTDAVEQSPYIKQILVCSNRQEILASSPGPIRDNMIQALALADPLARLYGDDLQPVQLGQAVRPNKDGAIIFSMMRKTALGAGDSAALVMVIDLDALFTKTLKDQVYGKEGYGFIGDTLGRVLSHPSIPFTDQRGQVFMEQTLSAIKNNQMNQIIGYPWEGRFKHLSFAMIPGTSMYVAATVWDDDLFSLAKEINSTQLMIGGATLAVILLVLSLAIVFFVSRPLQRLTGDLSRNADSLESASQQISASGEQLSSGSSELAASVEEISSSLEELESVVELNTKNINESELLMRDTNEGAQKVSARMDVLGGALREIAASSDEIVKIIEVIEDIAFQTNILALNAAVEAGRAGDAGRGFSVVADQVKDLAQKSSTAAKETSRLIQKALRSIERGETLGSEVIDIQKKAAHMTNQVSTLLDEVNRASQEQMRGIKQITISVGQTNAVVQQTASSAEETASASEELNSQAEELNAAVGMLSRLIRGKAKNFSTKPKTREEVEPTRSRKPLPKPADHQLAAGPMGGTFDPDKLIPMNDEFKKI